jgi:hypothetical protein
MQNNNVSGTIKTVTGISCKTNLSRGGAHSDQGGDLGGAVEHGDAAEAGAEEGHESASGDDGIKCEGDGVLKTPETARPGQFPINASPDRDSAITYDRLEVNPLGLHLRSDPTDVTRGRGVFSDRRIPAGTLIEEAPVLLITKGQWEEGKMDDCILGEYGFCWTGGGQGIGLGLGELTLPWSMRPVLQSSQY